MVWFQKEGHSAITPEQINAFLTAKFGYEKATTTAAPEERKSDDSNSNENTGGGDSGNENTGGGDSGDENTGGGDSGSDDSSNSDSDGTDENLGNENTENSGNQNVFKRVKRMKSLEIDGSFTYNKTHKHHLNTSSFHIKVVHTFIYC